MNCLKEWSRDQYSFLRTGLVKAVRRRCTTDTVLKLQRGICNFAWAIYPHRLEMHCYQRPWFIQWRLYWFSVGWREYQRDMNFNPNFIKTWFPTKLRSELIKTYMTCMLVCLVVSILWISYYVLCELNACGWSEIKTVWERKTVKMEITDSINQWNWSCSLC